ncbi:hypothetical protein [Halobacterium yunchengense]|uniref:hypothetical protein n=1 Tax=Halobacterium yunchengense TaxID=3108497 RepID=UPI003008F95E
MNKLPAAGDDAWRLARHAHVVVYEARDGGELLTVYDCGAAQAPPRAQIVGSLARTTADHEVRPGPTGDVVKLREPAVRRERSEGHFVVEPRDAAEN